MILAGLGVAALMAAPATAAPANCNSGATCLWKDANYSSEGMSVLRVEYQYHIGEFAYHYYWQTATSPDANDTVSSVYNNGNSQSSMLFIDTYAGGLGFVLAKKTGAATLGSAWDNKLSSGYFCGYTTRC